MARVMMTIYLFCSALNTCFVSSIRVYQKFYPIKIDIQVSSSHFLLNFQTEITSKMRFTIIFFAFCLIATGELNTIFNFYYEINFLFSFTAGKIFYVI